MDAIKIEIAKRELAEAGYDCEDLGLSDAQILHMIHEGF